MATQQWQIAEDNSTLANFKAWAKAISDWFRTCGWTNTSDTGQVNWSTIAAVPSNSYVYDIFAPGDGLTPYYVKIEYGYSTTTLQIAVSLGTGTDGAGNLTKWVTSRRAMWATNLAGGIANVNAVTQFECNFTGDSGRIGIMMWRNSSAAGGQLLIAIQRTLDSSGNPTNEGVSLWKIGYQSDGHWNTSTLTIIFGNYPVDYGDGTGILPGIPAVIPLCCYSVSGLGYSIGPFSGLTPFSPAFHAPFGKMYPPSNVLGFANLNDFTDGAQYTFNDNYGNSHTWMFTRSGAFSIGPFYSGWNVAVMMRYD